MKTALEEAGLEVTCQKKTVREACTAGRPVSCLSPDDGQQVVGRHIAVVLLVQLLEYLIQHLENSWWWGVMRIHEDQEGGTRQGCMKYFWFKYLKFLDKSMLIFILLICNKIAKPP